MNLTLKAVYLFENKVAQAEKPKLDVVKKQPAVRVLTLENMYGFSKVLLNEAEENGTIEVTSEDEAMMRKMTVMTDKIIDQTVPLDEKSNAVAASAETKPMGTGQQGFAYEKTVIDALKKAKASGKISAGAGACAVCADADMNIYGDIFNVEVKLNKQAQMGGGSLRYFGPDNISFSQKDMDEATKELLTIAVKNNADKITRLVEFLSAQSPAAVNSKSKGFPGTWTKAAWMAANKAGLLFNMNKAASVTVDHLANHYDKKGVYYIQIGGAGLFYLNKNPANLPVPKLEGSLNIEMGTRPAGSRSLSSGIRVVGAGIRVQGRLKTTSKSPYTLDDPSSIQKLLAAVKKNKGAGGKQPKPETLVTATKAASHDYPSARARMAQQQPTAKKSAPKKKRA